MKVHVHVLKMGNDTLLGSDLIIKTNLQSIFRQTLRQCGRVGFRFARNFCPVEAKALLRPLACAARTYAVDACPPWAGSPPGRDVQGQLSFSSLVLFFSISCILLVAGHRIICMYAKGELPSRLGIYMKRGRSSRSRA